MKFASPFQKNVLRDTRDVNTQQNQITARKDELFVDVVQTDGDRLPELAATRGLDPLRPKSIRRDTVPLICAR